MPLLSNFLATLGLLVVFTIGVAPISARAEQRIALVLGNAAYEAGALKTTANDAGLVAQTLEAAGFEVVGARDLDHDALRRAFRDFLDKAGALGPDDVALLYLGGYGLQLEGENYFVPTDARIERASDVAVHRAGTNDPAGSRCGAGLKNRASRRAFLAADAVDWPSTSRFSSHSNPVPDLPLRQPQKLGDCGRTVEQQARVVGDGLAHRQSGSVYPITACQQCPGRVKNCQRLPRIASLAPARVLLSKLMPAALSNRAAHSGRFGASIQTATASST
jgi:Caspase domain